MSTQLDTVRAGGTVDPRARNALRHGLSAGHVLDCEQKEYEAALAQLNQLHEPSGPVERVLCDRIARLTVRLARAGRLEAESFAACFEDVADGGPRFNHLAFERLVACIGRYEMAIGRALAKAAHEMERLTNKQRGEAVSSPTIVDFNW